MKTLLVLVACSSLMLPTIVAADGPPSGEHRPPHPGHGNGNGGHGNGNGHGYGHGYGHWNGYGYAHYRPVYRYYYPRPIYPRYVPTPVYYGGYGHQHHDDDDDALWAIGGLLVGAVIGGAMERSRTRNLPAPPPSSAPSASAPPQAGPPPGCRDVIVYDASGNPSVQRECNE